MWSSVLSAAPIGDGEVDFFPGEGVRNNALASPADCIFARVIGETVNVLVNEFQLTGTASPAQLRVDRIETAARPTSSSPPAGLPPLIGHVETLGDVRFSPPWLGNPNSHLRLEGFAFETGFTPPGVVLNYSCRLQDAEQACQGKSGEFIGSRGHAKPINTVAFTLSGPRAGEYDLSGQVVFSDTPPLPISAGQELAGPTRTEHLVALRLDIKPKQNTTSPWRDHPSLEIFRKA